MTFSQTWVAVIRRCHPTLPIISDYCHPVNTHAFTCGKCGYFHPIRGGCFTPLRVAVFTPVEQTIVYACLQLSHRFPPIIMTSNHKRQCKTSGINELRILTLDQSVNIWMDLAFRLAGHLGACRVWGITCEVAAAGHVQPNKGKSPLEGQTHVNYLGPGFLQHSRRNCLVTFLSEDSKLQLTQWRQCWEHLTVVQHPLWKMLTINWRRPE